MNQFKAVNEDNKSSFNHLYSDDDDYDDEDDFITFQFESKKINILFSQFSKYSKLIRNKYVVSDVRNRFPQELHDFQSQNSLDTDNIYYFFQLLQKDFNIDESLSYKRYIDLSKLSEFLEIKKLSKKLNKYFKIHEIDTSFIIQIILHETQAQKDPQESKFYINENMEENLSQKINESLQNEQFAQLPISVIYRVVERSDKKQLSCDLLYIFIMKSASKFHPLFSFIDLKNLSEQNLRNLYDNYTQSSDFWQVYVSYLKCNVHYLIELIDDKKNLQNQLKISEDKINNIQKMLVDSNQQKNQLQSRLDDLEIEKKNLQSRCDDLEIERSKLLKKLDDSEKEKNQMKTHSNSLESENSKLQILLSVSNKEKNQVQDRLNIIERERDQLKSKLDEIEDEKCKISGSIKAKVTDEIFINAEIKLVEKGSPLDKAKSKYIISKRNDDIIGSDAYRDGEPINSLNLKTINFTCVAGTYYVRALVFDSRGKSSELVSNKVTSNGTVMKFGYEGRVREVVLQSGRYLLEVWGAQGGDSVGTRRREGSEGGKGGLGGYSKGTLTLTKETKIFVVVGQRGRSASQSDGSETSGGFPDGGGTKTGHYLNYTSVPGTGGGSTSIRVGSNSLYTRVIVAGGGGGAGGDDVSTDHGGFGGGSSGGNSYACGKLQSQGSGTQTGSTPGPKGSGPPGVAGTFGQGATSLYMHNCCSGGGGGGGWYGGGSGGYGCNTNCASGGGGSGWIFTSSSLSNWKSGDSSNGTQFLLDSSLYLSNASTVPGNSSFKSPGGGNETGHKGDGYAKITVI